MDLTGVPKIFTTFTFALSILLSFSHSLTLSFPLSPFLYFSVSHVSHRSFLFSLSSFLLLALFRSLSFSVSLFLSFSLTPPLSLSFLSPCDHSPFPSPHLIPLSSGFRSWSKAAQRRQGNRKEEGFATVRRLASEVGCSLPSQDVPARVEVHQCQPDAEGQPGGHHVRATVKPRTRTQPVNEEDFLSKSL